MEADEVDDRGFRFESTGDVDVNGLRPGIHFVQVLHQFFLEIGERLLCHFLCYTWCVDLIGGAFYAHKWNHLDRGNSVLKKFFENRSGFFSVSRLAVYERDTEFFCGFCVCQKVRFCVQGVDFCAGLCVMGFDVCSGRFRGIGRCFCSGKVRESARAYGKNVEVCSHGRRNVGLACVWTIVFRENLGDMDILAGDEADAVCYGLVDEVTVSFSLWSMEDCQKPAIV